MNKSLREKLIIARRVGYILQTIPYVRMIGLCNSVALGTASETSDIDIFMIVKAKHIFTARYTAVFWQTIFGLKPYPSKKQSKNRISLSLFLSTDALNMDRICKDEYERKKRIEWITNVIPLYDENNTYLDFVDKNSWVKKYVPNYYMRMSENTKDIKFSTIMFLIQRFKEFIYFFGIGYIVEIIVRSIQIKRLNALKRSHKGKEKIIVNDKMIKIHFLENDDSKELY